MLEAGCGEIGNRVAGKGWRKKTEEETLCCFILIKALVKNFRSNYQKKINYMEIHAEIAMYCEVPD